MRFTGYGNGVCEAASQFQEHLMTNLWSRTQLVEARLATLDYALGP